MRIEEASRALVAEDRKSAEAIFRDILKIDPSHVNSLCGLAAVSLTVSRGQDALRLLRHAQKQSAHLPLTLRGLCQTLIDLGQLLEAEATIHRLLRIDHQTSRHRRRCRLVLWLLASFKNHTIDRVNAVVANVAADDADAADSNCLLERLLADRLQA